MQQFEDILYSKQDGVATISINRPWVLNAFRPRTIDEMLEAFHDAWYDDSIGVVVLTGEQGNFCTGGDQKIRGQGGYNDEEGTPRLQVRNLHRMIREIPKPVIAMVQGHCLAGATQMCICCDITFVAEDATIGFPSIPAGAGLIGQMWTWVVGPSRAKYMSFLPGSQLTGKEAEGFGWATMAFPRERLERETYSYAKRIARVPPELLQIKKLSINRTVDLQGFRAATMFGAEWDTIAHETEGVKDLQRSIKDRGLRATIESFKEQ